MRKAALIANTGLLIFIGVIFATQGPPGGLAIILFALCVLAPVLSIIALRNQARAGPPSSAGAHDV